MKFFLDTADLNEIRQAVSLGILDGVTTNPTLIRKAGARDFHEHIRQICELVPGDVSAEVTAVDYEGMLREARQLAKIHERVVVKIPLIPEGIRAIKTLSEEGVRTNCTLCFSATQALVAAKAGATYISPFVGRLDDISSEGMTLIGQVVQIYRNYDFRTQVLAASLRHPMHVLDAALVGADVATMPFPVMMQLLKHPLTDIGLERFLKDWEAYLQAQKSAGA
ncbi:fructose-6-phosphate aldolase [Limisphaera sp. 4302-co]|uniref:fructose-6-phosphate aldolase n=1 Tax=Limisphaera sp. 4302-co TaxID=3400417 RepID=UPI003C1AE895